MKIKAYQIKEGTIFRDEANGRDIEVVKMTPYQDNVACNIYNIYDEDTDQETGLFNKHELTTYDCIERG